MQRKLLISHQAGAHDIFRYTMCVNRPAPLRYSYASKSKEDFNSDPMQRQSTFKSIIHIDLICLSCNVGCII